MQVQTDPEFREGKKYMRLHMSVERSPAVRRAAIALQGTDCTVCGFAYRTMYGPLGDGFVEVHHLSPLGTLRAEAAIDPVRRMSLSCAQIAIG
jgi:5-methylcytosine-specific restriction enzyme A